MKLVINPLFESHSLFLHQIPTHQYPVEETFCKQRNCIEKVTYGQEHFVIKRYKRPTWINCLIYTWIRKSKAQRSYEYAFKLQQKGFDTATPVAYIECKKWGILHTCYFISQYIDQPLLSEVKKEDFAPEAYKKLMQAIAQYVLDLHQNGIIPLDMNPKNIFYKEDGNGYRFSIIDINRMKWGETPSLKESMKVFSTMQLDIEDYSFCIGQYAQKRGFKKKYCYYYVLRYDLLTQAIREIKRKLFKFPKKK